MKLDLYENPFPKYIRIFLHMRIDQIYSFRRWWVFVCHRWLDGPSWQSVLLPLRLISPGPPPPTSLCKDLSFFFFRFFWICLYSLHVSYYGHFNLAKVLSTPKWEAKVWTQHANPLHPLAWYLGFLLSTEISFKSSGSWIAVAAYFVLRISVNVFLICQ